MYGRLSGLTCAISLVLLSALQWAGAQTIKTGIVKIGSDWEISGNFVGSGLPAATGVRMAVKEINDKGGFTVGDTHYTLQLVEVDNQSTSASAVSGITKLVEDEKAKFVFGPIMGALAAQTAEIAASAKAIAFSPGGTWQTKGYLTDPRTPLLFGTQISLSRLEKLDVTALKELGAHKVAYISLDDDTTKANLSAFREAIKGSDITVNPILFPPGTSDFSSYVTRAKGDGADAVYFLYPHDLTADLLRATVDLGVAPKGFGARATDPGVAVKGVNGKPLPFPFFSSFNTPSIEYPVGDKVLAFRDRLRAFAPSLSGPNQSSVLLSYDFVYMLVEAMKRAGTVEDTAKIGNELGTLTYDGVDGRMCFPDGIRNIVLDTELIWVRDGKVQPQIVPSDCKG